MLNVSKSTQRALLVQAVVKFGDSQNSPHRQVAKAVDNPQTAFDSKLSKVSAYGVQ